MGSISHIIGRGLPLRGDDIDTDRIIPARYLRAITFEGIERHVFEDERKAAPHPFDDLRFSGAAILLVDSNFGCGSSREHAPQALARWGIRAIIGTSFAEIFFGNAVMIGLPCVRADAADVGALMSLVERNPSVEIQVDLEAGRCTAGDVSCAISLPPSVRDAFAAGTWDTTGLLRERYDEVETAAARLPYLSGFNA